MNRAGLAIPPIVTDRLMLRRLAGSDAPGLYALASDPEVSRHMVLGELESLEGAHRWLDGIEKLYADPHAMSWHWALAPREEGARLFGSMRLTITRPELCHGDVGFMVARAHWDKGYATEALRAILTFGFETLGLSRVSALTEIPNGRSGRVFEKCGFTLEGTTRGYYWKDNAWVDMRTWAITRTDWDGQVLPPRPWKPFATTPDS